MAKAKAEEKINLDSILFKCRDILRAARNSGSFFEKPVFFQSSRNSRRIGSKSWVSGQKSFYFQGFRGL